MTNFSPNVVAREFDFSDYAVRSSTAILGVVGYATKGPCHQPIFVSNERELVDTFGFPEVATVGQDSVTKNLVLSALQFLREGNQMIVVRCNTAAASASANLVNGSAVNVLAVTAVSPGSWGSAVSVRVSAGTAGGSYFKMEVLVDGVVREKYDNLTTLAADPTNWASARINSGSFLIQVTEAAGAVSGNLIPLMAPTTTALTGGSDGNSPTASDYFGAGNGLDVLADTDLVSINMLITPGASREVSDATQTVARAAIALCEARGDCIYLMDPIYTLATATQTRDSVNGGNGEANGPAIDSSYASFCSPWIQVYDTYNRKAVWVPPSAFQAAQCAYNDRVAHAWFAAAGLTRGKLKNALAVKFSYKQADLEVVQAPREVVNPIRNIVREGIVIWGQRTMQRKSSALDRLNVRRMLNYAKSTVIGATKVLIFEQNDSKTWRKFLQLVNPVIQHIKETRGLYDFRVICDATTNPPATIDQYLMQAKILLKPTKTAEIITVDFNVLSTGASFNEFI